MDDFLNSGVTEETVPSKDIGFLLPGYFAYLSLGFKWITTLVIFLMAGWVLTTIKVTRRLHRPHNIFVGNLMATCMITALIGTSLSTIIVFGYITGLGDFIDCNVYQFLLSPTVELYYSFLLISFDKVIAIAMPFKHRRVMRPHIVAYLITASWILAIVPFTPKLFNPGSYEKVPQYSACLSMGGSFIESLLFYTLPILLSSLVTVAMDVYLSIKAYNVSKQIEKETRLSGGNSTKVKSLKQQLATTKKHLKPMITLLIAVLGSTFTGMIYSVLYIPVRVAETATAYTQFIELIFASSIVYIFFLTQPLIYGLYYKQTREPMMKLLKSVIPCPQFKSATVAPAS